MSIEITNAQSFLSWMDKMACLNSIAPDAAKRFVKRGQVYWCHFGLNIGSEMSKATPRPAVIVSNYNTNKNSSNVIVVPVTHSKSRMPYLVPITPIKDPDGNIILDGQADTACVECVSKARLGGQITVLSAAQMKAIDKSLLISLELIHYYNDEIKKNEKMLQYIAKVKEDRNRAQDTVQQLREIISQGGFDDDSQKKVKKLLDIE